MTRVTLTPVVFRALAQAVYCSPVCQRVHWTEGGHKTECKELQAVTQTAKASTVGAGDVVNGLEPDLKSDSPTHFATEWRDHPAVRHTPVIATCAVNGEACIICLESDPPPIQSGCACRGDAGMVHVDCRLTAGAHKMGTTGCTHRSYRMCPTCDQEFTGAIALALAEENMLVWLHRDGVYPACCQFARPATLLANTLLSVGKYAEAEIVCREWMEYVNHIIVSEKCASMITLRKALACALDCQGRHADAIYILWQCFNEFRSSESGDIHINETVRLIGDCYVHHGEFDHAVDVLQRILDIAFESAATTLNLLSHSTAA